MARVKVKSGNIYQIILPNDLGFAYAKCINLLEINHDARYPILIRIYNYRSALPQRMHKFIGKELILCPLLIAGILPSINNASWKLIDYEPLQQEDINIPHYKRGEPDESPEGWFYVVDADIYKKNNIKIRKCKAFRRSWCYGFSISGN
jgi:hypothetical protein